MFSESELTPSMREASPFMALGLRIVDSAIIALMLYPVVMLYTGNWTDYYENLAIVAFFLSFLIFHYMGIYKSWRGQGVFSGFQTLLGAWLLIAGMVLFLLFVFKVAGRYSRFVLLVWFMSMPLILFMLHAAIRVFLRRIRSAGRNQRTSVIVGAGDLGLSLARNLSKSEWVGIRILGFFDDHKTHGQAAGNEKRNYPVLGTLSDLPDYLNKNRVDYVYITLPMRAEKKIQEILKNCRTSGARIYLVPDLYAFSFFNSRFRRFGDVVLIDFDPESDAKRIFDMFFSLSVIAATLPLTAIIALIIKLQDKGPIFYAHRRITVAGKEFFCLKFRTMHVDADRRLKEILEKDEAARQEWEKNFKLKNDPRVTWIGRFLRKTSLDELPQFINVLKGEMSVVGARPIVYRELVDYYKENDGIYCSIKPGITGIWQVSKRNDTEDYQERVELDTWYALNRSFWLDLKIICMTVVCMLRGKGAY